MTAALETWVCVDCYVAHHYGETAARAGGAPEEWRMPHGINTLRFTDDTDSDTGEGIYDFSNSQCDACNSRLAGARYRLADWIEAGR